MFSIEMESVAESLEHQYRTHQNALQGFCFRMLGDAQVAQDVTQEVFLAACEQGLVEKGWLFTTARNRCIDRLRRRSIWQRVRETLVHSTGLGATMEEQVVDRDLGWRVLRRLSPKMRSLLLLKAYGGLSYKELAELFETTPSAIGVMLTRARKKALKEMKK